MSFMSCLRLNFIGPNVSTIAAKAVAAACLFFGVRWVMAAVRRVCTAAAWDALGIAKSPLRIRSQLVTALGRPTIPFSTRTFNTSPSSEETSVSLITPKTEMTESKKASRHEGFDSFTSFGNAPKKASRCAPASAVTSSSPSFLAFQLLCVSFWLVESEEKSSCPAPSSTTRPPVDPPPAPIPPTAMSSIFASFLPNVVGEKKGPSGLSMRVKVKKSQVAHNLLFVGV